jgi:hypothetical protein
MKAHPNIIVEFVAGLVYFSGALNVRKSNANFYCPRHNPGHLSYDAQP